MAIEMYKDIETEIVSAKDTIIDDLVDMFHDEDPDITDDEATKAAIELFTSMVEAGELVKVK